MTENFISALALIISLISVLLSVYFSARANRYNENALQIELHAQKREWVSSLRGWGFEAIDAVSDVLFLFSERTLPNDQIEARLVAVRRRLSATIDKGRLFLPNDEYKTHGTSKSLAYRGFRPPALNILVAVYDLTREFNEDELEENMRLFWIAWEMRKEFVSELQAVVDPRDNIADLMRLIEEIKSERLR